MRFHLLGLVHLPTSAHYNSCAFTQKNVKLARMLMSLGHEVIVYGARSERHGDEPDCAEFVETHITRDIRRQWGDGDNRFEIGYDWQSGGFRHDLNSETVDLTHRFRQECIKELSKRKQDNDFLLVTQGVYQKPIADAVDLFLTCEPGIGYRGSYARWRAFESSYLQNFTYGSQWPFQSVNGHYYDRVIPNYFDPDDFRFSAEKDDYYLYIGRMIIRKGVWTAVKATEAIGARLVLAGQQDPEIRVVDLPAHCEYIGFADIETRKRLMARAIATFVPTEYLEPFAGVHIESMLSGTPPLTTNFGVFPETIPDYLNGKVGFRCNTLQDFVDAARVAPKCDAGTIRKYGERFLMDNVKHEFQRWFEDLYAVYESARAPSVQGWHRLNERGVRDAARRRDRARAPGGGAGPAG